MKISVVTPVFNGAGTIGDCLDSVARQTHPDVEHIVIDGGSSDGTPDVVRAKGARVARFVSEPDRGIYDAMNKGIALASGDVIGILNSDDWYAGGGVLAKVAAAFAAPVDAVFADLVYVRPEKPGTIVRYYSGKGFSPAQFASGRMPPHPTFFLRRECYLKYGGFKTDYRIAADFELLARLMAKNGIRYRYLPEVWVRMRTGGASTRSLRSNLILNREILRACAENGIATNVFKVYSKYLAKWTQLLRRPA